MPKHNRLYAILTLVLVGTFFYTQTLPSFFPLQHTVPQDDLSGAYDRTEEEAVYHGVTAISSQLAEIKAQANVLGYAGDKRIEVDLTNQRLYGFQGNMKVYDFPISSGLYDWTPRGDFNIWIKLKYTKMSGGSQALGTYYYLPNVPFVMYFYNDDTPKYKGFGLHGTYWHNDFGRPKSHGCINLPTAAAEQLYYWTDPYLSDKNTTHSSPENPGTPITIYGKYKSSS